MQTYDSATILLGGKPFPSLTFETPAAMPDPHVETRCRCIGPDPIAFFAEMERLIPVRPEGVVMLSMPWGILGTIKVHAVVQGVTHKGGADVPSATTMEGALDERELRRTIANAVRRVIMNPYARDRAVCRALEAKDARFVRMAHRLGYSQPGGCYRGEKKQRKAMRRLLRAAGITRPAE